MVKQSLLIGLSSPVYLKKWHLSWNLYGWRDKEYLRQMEELMQSPEIGTEKRPQWSKSSVWESGVIEIRNISKSLGFFKPWKEFGFPSKDHEQPLGNLRSIKGQSDLYFRIMAPVSVWSIDWIGTRMEAEGSARGHCESPGRMWWWFWSMLVVEVKIKGSSEITESMWLQFFNFCKLFPKKFFFFN